MEGRGHGEGHKGAGLEGWGHGREIKGRDHGRDIKGRGGPWEGHKGPGCRGMELEGQCLSGGMTFSLLSCSPPPARNFQPGGHHVALSGPVAREGKYTGPGRNVRDQKWPRVGTSSAGGHGDLLLTLYVLTWTMYPW